VTFAGNMPGIDILACDLTQNRRITIQVKTRSAGTWHARFNPNDAEQGSENPAEDSFWVFVDLSPEHPEYFVVPRWWIRNNIWEEHTAYLARYERERGYPRKSDHHGIKLDRIEQWRGRWGVLGIF